PSYAAGSGVTSTAPPSVVPRVLVVEDRESLRRLVSKALEEDGYEVDSAGDGREGIALAESRDYALVLTDLKLPRASGIEVLKGVKQVQPLSPVVVLTAFGSVETAVEAMRLGPPRAFPQG
ncbi:MAG: response regulator, partial [Acidobacteriota bacterium]|nr:response regulator [Acidobacteriota bacterium]